MRPVPTKHPLIGCALRSHIVRPNAVHYKSPTTTIRRATQKKERTCRQYRKRGLNTSGQARRIEGCNKYTRIKQTRKARNLNPRHRRESCPKIEAREVRTVNSASNNCPQEALFESERLALLQATSPSNTRLYPSSINVMNIEEVHFDGGAEFHFFSGKT